MLSDYHVHLRTDEPDAPLVEALARENVERYSAAARAHGISELGVSEHVYRFTQALSLWRHPFWASYAHDDLDEYCAIVRQRTDLRLGLEVDYVPGAEERTAELIGARDLDYVIGSVHFISDGALDMHDYSAWTSGRAPEEIWERYFRALGASAASGLFDVIAHPDLVKYWGGGQPRPPGDPRRYYELALEGIVSSGVALEVSTAGLRKPAGEIYPAPALLELCVQAGVPIALSSDAHRPEHVGADYARALELLERAGVRELCVFERRSRRLERIGREAPGRSAQREGAQR